MDLSLLVIPSLLGVIGASIAVAKLLLSTEQLNARILFGHAILGAATSAIAGGVLHFVPNLTPPAIVAFGCCLGLLGHVFIEGSLKKYADKYTEKDKTDDS